METTTKAEAWKNVLFINAGSVWDIRIHLQNHPDRYSISQLMDELGREEALNNRATVKKMINARIAKLEKGIRNG